MERTENEARQTTFTRYIATADLFSCSANTHPYLLSSRHCTQMYHLCVQSHCTRSPIGLASYPGPSHRSKGPGYEATTGDYSITIGGYSVPRPLPPLKGAWVRGYYGGLQYHNRGVQCTQAPPTPQRGLGTRLLQGTTVSQ